MRVPITPATTLQRELRAQLRHNSPAGRVVVIVDGWDSQRTARFADSFAEVLGEDGGDVVRASVSDFLRPRSARGVEPSAGDIDVETLRRVLLDPFREGGQTSATTGFQLASWDADRDVAAESRWVTTSADAVLVLDGPFSQQSEIRSSAVFAIWLEISDVVLAARPGRSSDRPLTDSEADYARNVRPLRAATVLVDATAMERPFEFYRDFC